VAAIADMGDARLAQPSQHRHRTVTAVAQAAPGCRGVSGDL